MRVQILKGLVLIITLHIIFCSGLGQDIYKVEDIPESMLEDAKQVYWQNKLEIEIPSIKKMKYKVHEVFTLLDKDLERDHYYIRYDGESEIKKIKATIFDKNGVEIRKIKKKDILDQASEDEISIFTDDRYKYFNIGSGQYPYTVEVLYEVDFDHTNFGGVFYPLESKSSSLQSELIIEAYDGFDLTSKVYNSQCAEDTEAEDGKTIYSWKFENLPAVKYEIFGPKRDQILPHVLFAPNEFRFGKYEGSKADWQKFGEFIHQLNENRDMPSSSLEKEILKLIEGLTDQREIIETLYKYLQENTRYVSVQVGIGGWQTFDANYVENNKYGDCKALSNYMKTLLRIAGIESKSVLINGGRENFGIYPEIVSPRFNHVILYVPSADIWLECTSNAYPAGYIGSGNANKEVLLIGPDGGQFVETPVISTNEIRTQSQIELLADGNARFADSVHYTGALHETYRYLSRQYDEKNIKKGYLDELSLVNLDFLSFDYTAVTGKPEFWIHQSSNVPRFATSAGKRMFVPVITHHQMDWVPEKVEARKHDIHRGNARTFEQSTSMQLPEGYKIESMPESQQIDSDFGKYTLDIQVEGQMVYIHRTREYFPYVQPASRYDEFRQFYLDMAKLERAKIVLLKE